MKESLKSLQKVREEPLMIAIDTSADEDLNAGDVRLDGGPTAPQRIICYCSGGLGNRLLPLSSCIELSQQSGRQLCILWRNDDFRCQAGFNELFENEIMTLTDDDLKQIDACTIYADPQDVINDAYLNKKTAFQALVQQHGCGDRNAVTLGDAAQDIIIYHNNLLPGVDKYAGRRHLQQLNPIPALRDAIDAFASQFAIDQTVMGVHARGTDFKVSVRQYAEKISAVIQNKPDQRFLVCSDDREYEDRLKALFPNNVIIRPKQDHVRRADHQADWSNNTLTSNAAVKEAVIDIYLLARTDFKIYHTGSSFAQLVRMIKPLEVASLPAVARSTPPRHMPATLRAAYTMNGRIHVQDWYIDESRRDGNLRYTKDLIGHLLVLAEKRQSCNYGDTDHWLYKMLDRFPIKGKKVLVLGSQVPFYEAVCLAYGAYPTTVEFQKIRSDHPGLRTTTVDELAASQEQFDAAISISTFEHTGLGRYGDPLDPDGDIKAMLMLRTKVKHGGLLFLSVPMSRDAVVWNAHRIYGHLRFPHLIAGWDLLASIGSHADSDTYRHEIYFQPIHVLRNNIEPHLDLLTDLFSRHPNPVLVETGTALGRGVKAALRAGFETIYSIEENRSLFEFNRAQFADLEQVHILHGESLTILPEILTILKTPATFWLDAHRTGSGLDGGQCPYPLLEELRILQSHPIRSHTLLMDDRRLFESEFGIREEAVREAILKINPDYAFVCADSTPEEASYGHDDILVAVPPPAAAPYAASDPPDRAQRRRHHPIDQRILYYCPDVTVRSAGIRRLHRHVALLTGQGFNAFILHPRDGFKAPDQPDVPRLYLDQTALTDRDVVVIPEGHPNIMNGLRHTPCRRFVIALNWDYVFKTLPDRMDWRMFNIERVLAVSPFIGQMISWAMRLPIHLLDSSIDTQRFHYDPSQKMLQVAYIQRKAACIEPLLRLLAARKADYTDRIQWRSLADLTVDDYAGEIRKASIFLNLSPAEGFPTSCMEAMAAGALVVGFDGVGGRELLENGKNSVLVANGDYVSLAYHMAPLLDNMLNGGTASWQELRDNGFKTTAALTAERETESLVQFWQGVL